MKKIKQSVINTFNRVGIDYKKYNNDIKELVIARNWLSGESCKTTVLIAYLINWVYSATLALEKGESNVSITDFDRIRYFILEQDKNAYDVCID